MIICPQCGWENDDDFTFCLGCGFQLPPASETKKAESPATPAPATPAPATPPAAPADHQTCTSCGTSVPINNAFCGGCGNKMTAPPPAPATPPPADNFTQPVPTAAPLTTPTATVAPPSAIASSSPQPTARLVLLLPNGQEGGTYPLKPDKTLIGRKQGNILFLDDPYVSPLHATFFRTPDGQLKVKDENSLNGLFLRLRERIELSNQDVLLLGKQLLRFEQIHAKAEPPKVALNVNNPAPSPVWGSPYSSYWGRLIQLISGGGQGNAVLLGGNQVDLGRERGQLTFPGDRFISGIHARVSFENNNYFAEDLGSRNGTFIRVRNELTLQNNDILIIGEQLLRVEFTL